MTEPPENTTTSERLLVLAETGGHHADRGWKATAVKRDWFDLAIEVFGYAKHPAYTFTVRSQDSTTQGHSLKMIGRLSPGRSSFANIATRRPLRKAYHVLSALELQKLPLEFASR